MVATLISGVAFGAMYSLVAVGFVVLFKATGVLNLSHGQLVMWAAFAAVWLDEWLNPSTLPAKLAIIAAVSLIGAAMGIGVYMSVFRWAKSASLIALAIVSLGVWFVSLGLASMVWGGRSATTELVPRGEAFGGVRIEDLVVIGVAVACLLVFGWTFARTALGQQLRAVAEAPIGAAAIGLRIRRIHTLAWAMSGALAGIAGALLSSVVLANLDVGMIAIRALPAALIGGLDSIGGGVIGGVLLGLVETYMPRIFPNLLPGDPREVLAYGLLLIVLFLRPNGLWGSREVDRA